MQRRILRAIGLGTPRFPFWIPCLAEYRETHEYFLLLLKGPPPAFAAEFYRPPSLRTAFPLEAATVRQLSYFAPDSTLIPRLSWWIREGEVASLLGEQVYWPGTVFLG